MPHAFKNRDKAHAFKTHQHELNENGNVRMPTQLYGVFYDQMNIEELRKVACEKGYDSAGVDRAGLIMIIKGWGHIVDAKLLPEQPENSQDDSTEFKPSIRKEHFKEAKKTRTSPVEAEVDGYSDGDADADAENVRTNRSKRTQAEPINIIKTKSKRTRKAQPQDVQAEDSKQAIRMEKLQPTRARPGRVLERGNSQVRATRSDAKYEIMSIAQLKRIVSGMGYDSGTIFRIGLIAIAKGWGPAVEGENENGNPNANGNGNQNQNYSNTAQPQNSRGARQDKLALSPVPVQRGAPVQSPREPQRQSSSEPQTQSRSNYEEMNIEDLRDLANDAGHDTNGLDKAGLIMIAKGWGSLNKVRPSRNRDDYEGDTAVRPAQQSSRGYGRNDRNQSRSTALPQTAQGGQGSGATWQGDRDEGASKKKESDDRPNNYEQMSMDVLMKLATEKGYESVGVNRATLIMIAKGWGGIAKAKLLKKQDNVGMDSRSQTEMVERAQAEADALLRQGRRNGQASNQIRDGSDGKKAGIMIKTVERYVRTNTSTNVPDTGRQTERNRNVNDASSRSARGAQGQRNKKGEVNYELLPMKDLREIARENGYDANNVNRVSLILIAKGRGSETNAKPLQTMDIEDDIYMTQAPITRRTYGQDGSKWDGEDDNVPEQLEEPGSGQGNYEQMSEKALNRIAKSKGFDHNGVDRATLIMIAKGWGSLTKAKPLRDYNHDQNQNQYHYDNHAHEENTRPKKQPEKAIRKDYEAMPIEDLRELAKAKGYETTGIDRGGLIMIAKGWGSLTKAKSLYGHEDESHDRQNRRQRTRDSQYEGQDDAYQQNTRPRPSKQSTKVSRKDYEAMPIEDLRELAEEKGYDPTGVDRGNLIMIAKGWGSLTKIQSIYDNDLYEDDYRQQTQRGASSQYEAETNGWQTQTQGGRRTGSQYEAEENRWQTQQQRGTPRAQSGRTKGTQYDAQQQQQDTRRAPRKQTSGVPRTDYEAMPIEDLRELANAKGYETSGVDRGGLIMIAKGWGSLTTAKPIGGYDDNYYDGANRRQSSGRKTTANIDEDRYYAQQQQQNTRPAPRKEKEGSTNYESMPIKDLKQLAVDKGYDTAGVDRGGLIMIAKGWGSLTKAKSVHNDGSMYDQYDQHGNGRERDYGRDNQRRTGKRTRADIDEERYYAQQQQQQQQNTRPAPRTQSAKRTRSSYEEMTIEELRDLAVEMGYDPIGMDRTSLIMIAKGWGTSVNAKPLRGSPEAAQAEAEADALRLLAQENTRRKSRKKAKLSGSDYEEMSIEDLRIVVNDAGYEDVGMDRTSLIMIAKGWGESVNAKPLGQISSRAQPRADAYGSYQGQEDARMMQRGARGRSNMNSSSSRYGDNGVNYEDKAGRLGLNGPRNQENKKKPWYE